MEQEKKKNNKKIVIIVGIIIVLAVVCISIFGYSNYTKQKELEKLSKSENYFYEKLQTTVEKIEKKTDSAYDLCVTVADQLKKYGEARTFYSAYNSTYIRSAFEDVKTEMKILDDIKPNSNKYDTEHQKVVELYYEYKDIYNIGLTVPNSSYEDYAYKLAKEKAEYNTKLDEVRQLIPKVIKEEKY